MKKVLIILVVSFLVLAGILGAARLLVGGGEDTWICDEGDWIKHGVPKAPAPEGSCGE